MWWVGPNDIMVKCNPKSIDVKDGNSQGIGVNTKKYFYAGFYPYEKPS